MVPQPYEALWGLLRVVVLSVTEPLVIIAHRGGVPERRLRRWRRALGLERCVVGGERVWVHDGQLVALKRPS